MPKLSHFKKVVLVVTVGQRRQKVGTNVFKFLVPTENLMSSLRLDWNIIDDHHHRAASIEVLSRHPTSVPNILVTSLIMHHWRRSHIQPPSLRRLFRVIAKRHQQPRSTAFTIFLCFMTILRKELEYFCCFPTKWSVFCLPEPGSYDSNPLRYTILVAVDVWFL